MGSFAIEPHSFRYLWSPLAPPQDLRNPGRKNRLMTGYQHPHHQLHSALRNGRRHFDHLGIGDAGPKLPTASAASMRRWPPPSEGGLQEPEISGSPTAARRSSRRYRFAIEFENELLPAFVADCLAEINQLPGVTRTRRGRHPFDGDAEPGDDVRVLDAVAGDCRE